MFLLFPKEDYFELEGEINAAALQRIVDDIVLARKRLNVLEAWELYVGDVSKEKRIGKIIVFGEKKVI